MAFKKWLKQVIRKTGIVSRQGWARMILLAALLTIVNQIAFFLPWLPERYDVIAMATDFRKSGMQSSDRPDELSPARFARRFLLLDISNDMVSEPDTLREKSFMIPADAGSPAAGPHRLKYDLRKLTRLFKWLAANPRQYNVVVCNLYLDRLKRGPDTDSLLAYISAMASYKPSKILFAGLYDPAAQQLETTEDASFFSPHLPDSIKGAVNEELVDDRFYRYQLSYKQATIKTLPLLMLERIDEYKVRPREWWRPDIYRKANGQYKASNTFIPEMLFSAGDFDSLKSFGADDGYLHDTLIARMELWQALRPLQKKEAYHLEALLHTTDTTAGGDTSRKSIFIDAFSPGFAGLHKTMYGDMTGGLIVLNIYYNLLLRENQVDMGYFFFTFACFCVVALALLYSHKIPRPPSRLVFLHAIVASILDELHVWLLIGMTIGASIWFGKVAHVLVLATLVVFLSKVIEARRAARKENTDKAVPTDVGRRRSLL